MKHRGGALGWAASAGLFKKDNDAPHPTDFAHRAGNRLRIRNHACIRAGHRRHRHARGRCQRAGRGAQRRRCRHCRHRDSAQRESAGHPAVGRDLSDETLAVINSGGADIRGLSGRVPSLNIESSFGRTFPRFYIRGLGNTDFDLNASQPVSLIYDDVVLENPILKGFPAFDVDRVEVLRGPQGTLFGRNTPAGIVKFDTVRPDATSRNYMRVSYGTYSTDQRRRRDRRPADRYASRFALSTLWQHRNDWIDNLDEAGQQRPGRL